MVNVFQFNRNIRGFRRYWHIIRVLSKYGFDYFLVNLNLSHLIVRRKKKIPGEDIDTLAPAVRMRLALEELGPTFIKLGQFLSTRPDLLPASFIEEFAKLQDAVPSFSLDEVKAQIRAELGTDLNVHFDCFDPVPIAAASIAQVHRARLVTGEDVVVKVRRPGIVALVEADIDALLGLAYLAERHIQGMDVYDPAGFVKEFARTIRREMDLAREGHAIEKFAANFRGDPTFYFPHVHWRQTSRGVLTMEYIDGIKVTDFDLLDAAGLDRREIALRGAEGFLKQVLDHGYFHGDPHPGNVFILPDNVICMLDYGMAGRLDEQMRDLLISLLIAIVGKDIEELVALIVNWGTTPDTLDTKAFRRDVSEFIEEYYEIPLGEICVGRVFMEFMEIISTHRVRLDPNFMLLGKALILIEGMGRKLDPSFDMISRLRPFVEKTVRERVSARRMARDLRKTVYLLYEQTRRLPQDIREIIARINRNKFKIDLEHRGLDRFIREIDKSINRLSSSLLIAALLVGSSILVHASRGPSMFGFPLFAFLGFSIAGIIGMWLVIAIIRSGRM